MTRLYSAALLFALCSCPAIAQMSANDAFNEGSTFGTARNPEVREGIKTENAETIVPNYSATSEKSGLYAGMKNLNPDGHMEKTYCATAGLTSPDPKQVEACQATNLLAGMNETGNPFSINKETDPLMIKKREIQADPGAATGMPFTSSLSECTATSSTSADITRTETCTDVIPFPKSDSCQMPWEVEVLQHNRYECTKGKDPTIRKCNELLVVSCNSNLMPQVTVNRQWWWCDTCAGKVSDMQNLQDAFRAVAQASGASVSFTYGSYGQACFQMTAIGGANVLGYYNGGYFGQGKVLSYGFGRSCPYFGMTLGSTVSKSGKPMIEFRGNSECPNKVWKPATKDHPGMWLCIGYTPICPDGSPPINIDGGYACIGNVTCTSYWDKTACAPYGG